MTTKKPKVKKGDIISAATERWQEDNLVVIEVEGKYAWVNSVQGEVGIPLDWITKVETPEGDTE